jgi:hypothetical protein
MECGDVDWMGVVKVGRVVVMMVKVYGCLTKC